MKRYKANGIYSCIAFTILLSVVPNIGYASSTSTPTLPVSHNDLIPILQGLIADPDCELPCFLGIRPGETTGDGLITLLTAYLDVDDGSAVVNARGAINYPLALFFEQGALFVNFRGNDNTLSRMNVVLIGAKNWLEAYNPFELSAVVNTLGTPSKIYVAINGGNPLVSILTLVYELQEVMVQYTVELPDIPSSMPISICPSPDNIVRIEAWLDSNLSRRSVLDYLEPSPDDYDGFGSNWTLERMTGVDIGTFVSRFTRDPNACLEVPSYTELYELGYRGS